MDEIPSVANDFSLSVENGIFILSFYYRNPKDPKEPAYRHLIKKVAFSENRFLEFLNFGSDLLTEWRRKKEKLENPDEEDHPS